MPEPTPVDAGLAEPMARALQGESGTVVGLDYRGERVLAAYESVRGLAYGVVAKIDLREIREPFLRAGGLAGGIAIALVALGVWSTLRITSPLVRRLENRTEELQTARNRLRAAAAEATLAEERERRNLAIDLHDGLGQLLAFGSMRLGMLRDAVECYGLDSRVREIEQLISEVHQRAGSLTFQLSPPVLHEVGFSGAAQWLTEDLERRFGLHITPKGKRGRKKLHLGVDGPRVIVAQVLTDGSMDDAATGLRLIDGSRAASRVSQRTQPTTRSRSTMPREHVARRSSFHQPKRRRDRGAEDRGQLPAIARSRECGRLGDAGGRRSRVTIARLVWRTRSSDTSRSSGIASGLVIRRPRRLKR